MKLTAYSVKLKKVVEIANPKIVTMKNGRKAVQGVASEDPSSKVFRILSDKDVAEVEKQIGLFVLALSINISQKKRLALE